jgi:hypothetical protein
MDDEPPQAKRGPPCGAKNVQKFYPRTVTIGIKGLYDPSLSGTNANNYCNHPSKDFFTRLTTRERLLVN